MQTAPQTDKSRDDFELLRIVPDATEFLKLSRGSIYNLITAGKLRPIHVGRAVRISRGELRRFVASQSAR